LRTSTQSPAVPQQKSAPVPRPKAQQPSAEAKPPAQRKSAQPRASNDNAPRPPLPLLQQFFR
jgi:hypothetical protein